MNSQNRWYDEVSFPVTICDREGIILELNQSSIELFKEDGGAALIGKSLLDCHPEPARSILVEMLKTQSSHTYISNSNGKPLFVHETPWYKNGEFQGFVEILVELPATIHLGQD